MGYSAGAVDGRWVSRHVRSSVRVRSSVQRRSSVQLRSPAQRSRFSWPIRAWPMQGPDLVGPSPGDEGIGRTQLERLAGRPPVDRSVELRRALVFKLLVGRADEVLIIDDAQARYSRKSILYIFTVTCNPPRRETGTGTTGPTAQDHDEDSFPVVFLTNVPGNATRMRQKWSRTAPLPYGPTRRRWQIPRPLRPAPSPTCKPDFSD